MSDKPIHTIVLSPHLDDGVLSCGGETARLTSRGERVVMVTLCTADMGAEPTPFARKVFRYMNLDWRTGMAQRREEDFEACRLVGAEALHFDVGEAINRFVPTSKGSARCPYTAGLTLFGPPDREDERRTSAQLDSILNGLPRAARWLVPLGIGGHVDHRLVRAAAERCAPLANARVLYYEDFPYSRKLRNRLKVLGLPWSRSLDSSAVALDDSDLEAKIEGIAAYRSQVEPLFGDRARLADAVQHDARRCGGEPRWSPAGPTD